jgi:hypothetical protein
MPVGRSSSYNRSRDDKSSKGSYYIDRREIERRLRDKGEEMDRMQRERMQQERMQQGVTFTIGRDDPVVEIAAPAAAPVAAPVLPLLTEQDRVREYMNRPRSRIQTFEVVEPHPDQQLSATLSSPSAYDYKVRRKARNFPIGHNYTEPAAERPVITLSPEAQAYEESEKKLANELESLERGWGGGRKKRSTRTRQKKQRRHRHRRRSTKKYRK